MPNQARPASILLRPDQVAELLQQQVSTLAVWRRKGGGPPYVRLGHITVRYPKEDLYQWIQERTATSTAEEFGKSSARQALGAAASQKTASSAGE